MTDQATQAALEGWYTLDQEQPHLLGSRCVDCGTCYFPAQSSYCKNPDCDSEEFEQQVQLSRVGRLWSYTNACYQPPPPYVPADPFQPFTIAAVELEAEQMIVLGQVADGVGVEDLKVGDSMELVLGLMHDEGDGRKLVWQWKPLGESEQAV